MKQSRWRKSKERGVSPIIATILLVAITVVLAAVLYVLISGLTRGPGNTPIGSALAVSGATDSTTGTTPSAWFNYTISIQSASTGVTANSLKFQLVNSGGSIQAFSAVTLVDVSNCAIGTYTTAWTVGAFATLPHPTACAGGTPGLTSQISSGDELILTTSSSIAALGYTLNIIGTGSYSGSVGAAVA